MPEEEPLAKIQASGPVEPLPGEQRPARWVEPAPPSAGGSAIDARFVFGSLAALAFLWAGYEMTTLQSVGGNTVAEAFDHYVGYFSYGMAFLSLAIALPRRAP